MKLPRLRRKTELLQVCLQTSLAPTETLPTDQVPDCALQGKALDDVCAITDAAH